MTTKIALFSSLSIAASSGFVSCGFSCVSFCCEENAAAAFSANSVHHFASANPSAVIPQYGFSQSAPRNRQSQGVLRPTKLLRAVDEYRRQGGSQPSSMRRRQRTGRRGFFAFSPFVFSCVEL